MDYSILKIFMDFLLYLCISGMLFCALFSQFIFSKEIGIIKSLVIFLLLSYFRKKTILPYFWI